MCRARNQPDKAQKNDTLVKESEEKARVGAAEKGTNYVVVVPPRLMWKVFA
jgi:hypothetical protein